VHLVGKACRRWSTVRRFDHLQAAAPPLSSFPALQSISATSALRYTLCRWREPFLVGLESDDERLIVETESGSGGD